MISSSISRSIDTELSDDLGKTASDPEEAGADALMPDLSNEGPMMTFRRVETKGIFNLKI
jgi:hypothetical protein